MVSVEIAYKKGWHRLWLECDSMLVVNAFKDASLVPWRIRVSWNNCIILTRKMQFMVSHICREGNICTDKVS